MADHPTHQTRFSDSSRYDEVCDLCGAHDGAGGSRSLEDPCPYVGEAAMQTVLVLVEKANFEKAKETYVSGAVRNRIYVVEDGENLFLRDVPRYYQGENADTFNLLDRANCGIIRGIGNPYNLPIEVGIAPHFTRVNGFAALEIRAHTDTITNIAIRKAVLQRRKELVTRVTYREDDGYPHLGTIIALDYRAVQ